MTMFDHASRIIANQSMLKMQKLPRSFYTRSTIKVAKDLLGKYLVRKINNNYLIGKIVEVEAYLGEKDPASHAYRGRTKRNDVMFWQGGYLYVYFTYGMHFCANVVTEKEGKGRAVLLRAVEPIQGIEMMVRHRTNRRNGLMDKWHDEKLINLTNGPAKLCEAFRIKREENGTDLCGDDIFIINGEKIPSIKIISATRIGIKSGTKLKWRFYIKDNEWVS